MSSDSNPHLYSTFHNFYNNSTFIMSRKAVLAFPFMVVASLVQAPLSKYMI